MAKSMKLGRGGRSARLAAKLRARGGVRNVGALIGSIGRKKYGAKRMAQWSAASRRRHLRKSLLAALALNLLLDRMLKAVEAASPPPRDPRRSKVRQCKACGHNFPTA